MLRVRIVSVLGMLAGMCSPALVGQAAPRPGATILGRVLGQDGEPVRAATVWVTAWNDDTRVLQRGRTDGEGMFVCRRVPGPNCRVHAHGLGTTTATADVTDLRADRTTAAELRVWDARTLRGRVVDERGRAIAGASLVATKDFAVPPLRVDGTTDRDGAFELAGVPIGDVALRAFAPAFGFQDHTFHDWIDERADLVVKRDSARLEMRLVDAPAAVCAATNPRVLAVPPGSFALPLAIERPRFDADGVCILEGLPIAEWNVALENPDQTFLRSSVRALRGPAPEPLRFQAVNGRELAVTGQVVLGDKPLAWHPLLLHETANKSPTPLVTWTDGDGWFEFTTRASAACCFDLDDERYAFAQAKVRGMRGAWDVGYSGLHEECALAKELQLVAEPAAFVRGRVVDATGAPVPNAPVELQQSVARTVRAPVGDVTWRTFACAVSDVRGAFAIGGLSPTTLPVRLHAAGATRSGSTDPFQVGGPVPVLRVGAPGRVEGWLTDADGEPRIGVRVSLGASRETNTYTDCDGRFVFVGVDPGVHQLGYWRRGLVVPGDDVAVTAGGTARVELVFVPAR